MRMENQASRLPDLLNLFADETKWTKGVMARNALGFARGARESDATCFCMAGGILYLGGRDDWLDPDVAALDDACRERGKWFSISRFNDCAKTTIEDIRAVIRRAIEIRTTPTANFEG